MQYSTADLELNRVVNFTERVNFSWSAHDTVPLKTGPLYDNSSPKRQATADALCNSDFGRRFSKIVVRTGKPWRKVYYETVMLFGKTGGEKSFFSLFFFFFSFFFFFFFFFFFNTVNWNCAKTFKQTSKETYPRRFFTSVILSHQRHTIIRFLFVCFLFLVICFLKRPLF